MRWEYRVIKESTEGWFTVNLDDDSMERTLDELGREGWELVSTTGVMTNGYTKHLVLTLKRPLTGAEDDSGTEDHPLANIGE